MVTRTPETARTDLATAVGGARVRDAAERDEVDGVRPRWVVEASDTEQVAAAMRTAAEHGLRIVPTGSGSKLNWGTAPEAVDVLLDVSGTAGVREHAAGDLVVRAGAGTPLAEIDDVVRAAGQRLAIDHPLPTATVGGVIATALAGPCRHFFGGVRDLLIGITVVRDDGTVTTSGGKVVKNVAGYDLGKLYTGSHGTLGVITEAIFRLHPQADEHRWIAVTTPGPAAATAAVDVIRHGQSMPTAIEADRAGSAGPITVCAHIEGRPSATHDRALALAEQVTHAAGTSAQVLEQQPPWWGRLPFDPDSGTGLRIGVEPARMSQLLHAAQDVAESRGVTLTVRGAAGLGVVHAGLPAGTDPQVAAQVVTDLREHADYVVVLCAPRQVRSRVDVWGPVDRVAGMVMRRTKNQFDPGHRLAPGRFVGGI